MDLEYKPEPIEENTRRTFYHDSDGNFLTIFDNETEPIDPDGFEIDDFLHEVGYEGPNDWTKG